MPEPDKLLDLTTKVIKERPAAEMKPVLTMVGRVMLAQKFRAPEWIRGEARTQKR